MSDKDIICNMVKRFISNFTSGTPLSWFSDIISNYVVEAISPYIDLFLNNGSFDTELATSFIKKKTIEEIDDFKKAFRKEQVNENAA